MGPSEKIFKKSYALELFNIAENDFVTGQVLSRSKEVRRETILFHLEQAVEKTLKCVLCHYGDPVPFTHDLYAIVQKFKSSNMPPGGFALHDLTPFATIRRYEEGNYIIDDKDIENSIQLARDVLLWAKVELSK